MKIFVTGATGFLGKHIVASALERGHEVRAVARAASDLSQLPWADHPSVELAAVDLRSRRGLIDALEGVDVVIHAAAAKTGDLYAQLAGTVLTTENLITAMEEAGVRRIVAISTFSIYDYSKIWSHGRLDENSPTISDDAFDRDDYAQTKLIQERLLRDQEKSGWDVTILRPGVIYGKDNTWTARLGAGGKGRWWIRIGALARLPLTYVENCADATILAAETVAAAGKTLNVVDDAPPTQHGYAKELRRRMNRKPKVIFVPWPVMRLVGSMAMTTNKILFSGRAKLPSVLIPSRLVARFKHLRFDNHLIKETLGWQPRYNLQVALDRSFAPTATGGVLPMARPTAELFDESLPAHKDIVVEVR